MLGDDAITLLLRDHQVVRDHFVHIRETAAKARDPRNIRELVRLYQEVALALDVHEKVEELYFYPAVRGAAPEDAARVEEALDQQTEAKETIEAINRFEPTDPAWLQNLAVLMDEVEAHANYEEEEVFPLARAALGGERLIEIGHRMTEHKQRIGAVHA